MSSIKLSSDTLAVSPNPGEIEYNGDFYATSSDNSRAQLERIVKATAVNSTSGTAIDFTDIPAWVKKITVMLSGVSTSGTSHKLLQIGAGSITNTGYTSTGSTTSSGAAAVSSTAGFIMYSALATDAISGIITLVNVTGNIWVATHTGKASTANSLYGGGDVTLSATLDRIRITTVNGTDTFDAGSINIMYEG